jgi:beta-lactamase class A
MAKSSWFGAALLSIANLACGAPESVIKAEIAELAQPIGGSVGVAAWRLDGNGPRILVNERARFPMASTYKIAVAGAVFAAIDAGRLRLDQLIAIDPAMHVPSEVIENRFIHPGASLSIHNLLELMLTQSDNTATDVLMKLAGGGAAVTEWTQRHAGDGQRIDRDTAALLRDFFGMGPGPFKEAFAAALKSDPKIEERATQPNAVFDADPRDTSTPEAMSRLLTAIFNGRALSAASTTELKAILERCRTGEGRLKGRLPGGSVVAHKTGTVGGTVNDVGVMTLPQGKGQIVISVFVKQSSAPVEARERVIAEIARSVRDFYLFTP